MATTNRFTPGANQDNTLRTVTQDYQAPTYAATMAIVTTAEKTSYAPSQLSGALALSAGVGTSTTAPYVGDKLEILFASTPGATVTFGAGFAVSAATMIIAATKYGAIEFKFNGTAWVETNRTVTI